MNNNNVIFIGPSRFDDPVGLLKNFSVRPPARKGDIAALSKTETGVIVLVDGFMIQDYPPSPREVYEALERGKKIYGCSSIGALRAVELHTFGMIGSGWIFEKFISGEVDADDELVSILNPADWSSLTLPLINIRYAIEQLCTENIISGNQGFEIIREFKRTSIERRTKRFLFETGSRLGVRKEVCEQMIAPQYNIKKIDAWNCINNLGHN